VKARPTRWDGSSRRTQSTPALLWKGGELGVVIGWLVDVSAAPAFLYALGRLLRLCHGSAIKDRHKGNACNVAREVLVCTGWNHTVRLSTLVHTVSPAPPPYPHPHHPPHADTANQSYSSHSRDLFGFALFTRQTLARHAVDRIHVVARSIQHVGCYSTRHVACRLCPGAQHSKEDEVTLLTSSNPCDRALRLDTRRLRTGPC